MNSPLVWTPFASPAQVPLEDLWGDFFLADRVGPSLKAAEISRFARSVIESMISAVLGPRMHPREFRSSDDLPLWQVERKLINERCSAEKGAEVRHNDRFLESFPKDCYFQKIGSWHVEIDHLCIGVAWANSSRRSEREDAHFVKRFWMQMEDLCKPCYCLAVLDGHSGTQVVHCLRERLVDFVSDELKKMPRLGKVEVWKALKRAFVECDAYLKTLFYDEGQRPAFHVGAVVVLALVWEGDIWIANAGDCRAMWVPRRGEVHQLSEDARFEREKYVRSTDKRGGRVVRGRLQGQLAPARVFSNGFFLSAHEPKYYATSARPKITHVSQEEIEQDLRGGVLVLASDGLTDVSSTRNVGARVSLQGGVGESDLPEIAAKDLVAAALHAESTDDITVMVVGLAEKENLS